MLRGNIRILFKLNINLSLVQGSKRMARSRSLWPWKRWKRVHHVFCSKLDVSTLTGELPFTLHSPQQTPWSRRAVPSYQNYTYAWTVAAKRNWVPWCWRMEAVFLAMLIQTVLPDWKISYPRKNCPFASSFLAYLNIRHWPCWLEDTSAAFGSVSRTLISWRK